MFDQVIQLLKEKHGGELNLQNGEVYYLFLKDGLFSVYLDEEEKKIQVNVEFLPQGKTFVYHSDESLEKSITI